MKVIFHGDDFGLTAGVNQGIIKAFREGLLTSTSLMAVGGAADEAMDLALENPSLDVGIHLVLADEQPLLSPEALPALGLTHGRLPGRNRILKAVLTRTLDYGQVEAEWRAQVEKALKRGVKISHLDSHQFLHLFPGLFNVALGICRRYHIRFVRGIMMEPSLSSRITGSGIGRLAQWTGLWGWTRFMALAGCFPHETAVPSVGFLNAGGRMNCDIVLKILDKLAKCRSCALVEIMLHPGTGDPHTRDRYRHWHYEWRNDLNLLLDPDLRKGLEMRRIKTTSFGHEI